MSPLSTMARVHGGHRAVRGVRGRGARRRGRRGRRGVAAGGGRTHSAVSAFYYLRWARTMVLDDPPDDAPLRRAAIQGLLAFAVLFLGLALSPLLGVVQKGGPKASRWRGCRKRRCAHIACLLPKAGIDATLYPTSPAFSMHRSWCPAAGVAENLQGREYVGTGAASQPVDFGLRSRLRCGRRPRRPFGAGRSARPRLARGARSGAAPRRYRVVAAADHLMASFSHAPRHLGRDGWEGVPCGCRAHLGLGAGWSR